MKEYIRFCNRSRFQEKRNGLSPIEYREKAEASYTLFFIVYLTGVCALSMSVICSGPTHILLLLQRFVRKSNGGSLHRRQIQSHRPAAYESHIHCTSKIE
jgi:hypothetical protein